MTPTGLLMEVDYTNYEAASRDRWAIAEIRRGAIVVGSDLEKSGPTVAGIEIFRSIQGTGKAQISRGESTKAA